MTGDYQKLAESVIVSVKGYVARAVGPLTDAVAALSKRFDELPAPKDGKDGAPGMDGRDAGVEEVERAVLVAVEKAVSRLPKPVDGKDGLDGPSTEEIAALVRSAVAVIPPPTSGVDGKNGKDADQQAITADVLARVLEAVDSIPAPQPGKDGKDADPELMRRAVANEVTVQLAEWPRPKDGERGDDGKSVDPVAISAQIIDAATKAVAALPRPADGKDADHEAIAALALARVDELIKGIQIPKDGRDGDPGERGDVGPAGKDFEPEQMKAAVILEVSRVVKELPPALAGKDADDAAIADKVYERLMKSVRVPADGKSVTVDEVKPLLEGEVARWELEFERRAADVLQRAVDKLPKARDGKDGFSLDNFDAELRDGGRMLILKLSGGGREVVREMRMGVVIDRGVYKSAEPYQVGDGVTYGGSYWIAQKDTSESPGGDTGAWRMAIRRPDGRMRHEG